MTSDLNNSLDRNITEVAGKLALIPDGFSHALATGVMSEAEATRLIERTAALLEWSVSAVVQRE